MSQEAFAPRDGTTKRITVGAASARVLLVGGSPQSLVPVLVTNLGTATAWIRAGDSTVTAAVTNIGIGAGVCQVLRFQVPKATGELYIAAIAAGSTGDIEFTPGDGV